MIDPAFRRTILAGAGASPTVCDELLAYNENVFDHSRLTFAVEPEPFVEKWRRYAAVAERTGAYTCLQQKLVQLRFPIREGISQSNAYQRATRRGEVSTSREGLVLEAPDRLQLRIHDTPAGPIPLLITGHRPDFVALVRALTRRNEPAPVPASMGACMVAGYNNWDRVRDYYEAWAARTPAPTRAAWTAEFRRLIPQKHLYQDRFILLSDGPYSAVQAADLGLPEATWRHHALLIRREHECAHYFTRRLLGSMRSNILDELIADFMGITAAAGVFRADWFLRFMGLEAYPDYRSGGRLQNYCTELSETAFQVVQALVVRAAANLEAFSVRYDLRLHSRRAKALALTALTALTLESLAADAAGALLDRAWNDACAHFDRTVLLAAH